MTDTQPTDPADGVEDVRSLPLFARQTPTSPDGRRGRVRSDFTLNRTPPPAPALHLVPPQPEASQTQDVGGVAADQPYGGHGSTTAGPVSPAPVPSGEEPLEWALVAAFRQQASKLLMERLAGDALRYVPEEEKQEIGRAIIVELLQLHAAELVKRGEPGWSARQVERMTKAVFDSQFRMGRLQPLLDVDRVENIMITGCDRVVLEDVDGTLHAGPAVADSDQELIDFLAFLASRSQVNARPFSEAIPSLHMRLDGGERLAATAWVTPRPSVVIRRHRLRHVRLGELVRRGTLSSVAASFLAAAVRGRKSIVVAGGQGAGKTTLMRALCAEIDPLEPIGTFETEYELGLHELPEQHHIVHAWEARPGSGEIGPGGRRAGEYTMKEEIIDSFRMNLSRQIVGETRGDEVWSMIKVMESAPGSMCTTHAPSAQEAMNKLVTCAMEAGPAITPALATMKLAQVIDVVVQMHSLIDRSGRAPRRVRYVSEIIAVTPGEEARGWAYTTIFRHVPGQGAVAHILPEEMRSLASEGFDIAAFFAEANQHGAGR